LERALTRPTCVGPLDGAPPPTPACCRDQLSMVTKHELSPALAEAEIQKGRDELDRADRKVAETLDRLTEVEGRDHESDSEWQSAVQAADSEVEAAQEERRDAESHLQNVVDFWDEEVPDDEDDY
jgi:hypothetical protein